MNKLKTYLGADCDPHTGSSGFTNYSNNKPNPMAVFKDFPAAIIVDGSDDWSAERHHRPQRAVQDAGIEPLAWFHSGISGVSKSGVVLTPADYAKLEEFYLREFKKPLTEFLFVYRYDPETDPARDKRS